MHRHDLVAAPSTGKALGLFGPGLPKGTVLGQYTGQIVNNLDYQKLEVESKRNSVVLTPNKPKDLFNILGRPGQDLMQRANEPSKGQRPSHPNPQPTLAQPSPAQAQAS